MWLRGPPGRKCKQELALPIQLRNPRSYHPGHLADTAQAITSSPAAADPAAMSARDKDQLRTALHMARINYAYSARQLQPIVEQALALLVRWDAPDGLVPMPMEQWRQLV